MMQRTFRTTALFCCVVAIACSDPAARSRAEDQPSSASSASSAFFAKENLVAWCVVPFDARHRTPRERAAMLKELGITRLAYDWREKHIPTFAEELDCLAEEGIEFFAHWTPRSDSPGYEPMIRLIERHRLRPQLWMIAPSAPAETQERRVELNARALLPYVEEAKRLGCKLGIYNHGGWSGEPENMLSMVRWLRKEARTQDVGIVYNFHHGHEHLARFPTALEAMVPYLICVNLNGMTPGGPKIQPLGEGQEDRRILEMVRDSAYRGPLGILDHRPETDAAVSLRQNLDGLRRLLVDMGETEAARTYVEVDERPLPLRTEDAFPNLRIPRPVVLTHAGDGSGRIFVGEQFGTIHVFPKRRDIARTKVFLDIRDQVRFEEVENEEGFLGLAFHPDYEQNGYFFVYYTTNEVPNMSVISRFRVSADDPNRADPDSETEIMRIKQTSWNHNGGTLVFGPDGMLYIGLGDGGRSRDPLGHGQNLSTLLGSILRIDIDRRQGGNNYAIPPDNPFVDQDDACPEIWAYGLRNVWRMAFDPQTGQLWAADNGEDLWEEIDLIRGGGNYGWSLREGRTKFGLHGSGPRPDLIEPIWDYPHEDENGIVGMSIIGGCVYRGERLPMLRGAYLYGDYVVGSLWALRYDEQQQRVTENRPIQGSGLPVMTFGEDEEGEVYVTTMLSGGVIYRFTESPKTP